MNIILRLMKADIEIIKTFVMNPKLIKVYAYFKAYCYDNKLTQEVIDKYGFEIMSCIYDILYSKEPKKNWISGS